MESKTRCFARKTLGAILTAALLALTHQLPAAVIRSQADVVQAPAAGTGQLPGVPALPSVAAPIGLTAPGLFAAAPVLPSVPSLAPAQAFKAAVPALPTPAVPAALAPASAAAPAKTAVTAQQILQAGAARLAQAPSDGEKGSVLDSVFAGPAQTPGRDALADPSAGPAAPLPGLSALTLAGLYDGLYTDPLTGLFNNRYLQDHAAELARYGQVVMMDTDKFGPVDRALTSLYGETGKAVADEVLARSVSNAKAAAERVAGSGSVVTVRKGGEEILFFVKGGLAEQVAHSIRRSGQRFAQNSLELDSVLPSLGVDSDVKGVMAAITRQAVQEAPPQEPASERGPPPVFGTISLGVAPIETAGLAPEAALNRAMKAADEALTHSKEQGRNLVTVRRKDGHQALRIDEGPVLERTRGSKEMAAAAQRRRDARRAAQELKARDPAVYAGYIERAQRDPISGVKDYESIRANLDELVGPAGRHSHVLVLEMDAFKAFNDHPLLGHDIGDAALKGFGRTAQLVAERLGLAERLVISDAGTDVHIARARGKEFHVLGREADLTRFLAELDAYIQAEDPVIAEAARAHFATSRPTPEMVAAMRGMAQAQAAALGKDPGRVGRVTGAVEPVSVSGGRSAAQAYDAAVSKALARIDAEKTSRAGAHHE